MSERLYQLVNVSTENDLYFKTKNIMIHNEKLVYMLHEHQARVEELNTDIDSKTVEINRLSNIITNLESQIRVLEDIIQFMSKKMPVQE